jgi:hypothetical protein
MSERIKKGPESLLPISDVDVLKGAALMISLLEKQGRLALKKQDANGYNEIMFKKAQILAKLPEKLKELSKRRIPVSNEVRKLSLDWSKRAMLAIKNSNYFGMSILLNPIGIQESEPNELKKFINHLEKSKSPKK